MGVYIKNMKIPDCCDKCFALDYDDYPFCIISQDQMGYGFEIREKRMPSCPLVELSLHSDLIDRDKASERFAQLAEDIDNKFGFERSAAYTLASLFLQNKSEFPAIIKEE